MRLSSSSRCLHHLDLLAGLLSVLAVLLPDMLAAESDSTVCSSHSK